jgi:hypothetical protein
MLRIAGPVVVAMAYHAALMAAFVARCNGDPAALSRFGERWQADREEVGTVVGWPAALLPQRYPYEAVRFHFPEYGYDGQFFYALGRAPFARFDWGLDSPSYRQARLLYPLLAWVVSGGGDPIRLFWALPIVNLLVIGALAGLGAEAARRNRLSPWWGLLLPWVVSADLAALCNLCDALSVLMIVALLAAWLWRGPWWALGLLAAGALFSRQQNVLVVFSLLAVALYRRRWPDAAALAAAVVLFGLWVLRLVAMYHEFPKGTDPRALAPPFVGLVTRWADLSVCSPTCRDSRLIGVNLLDAGLLTFEMLFVVYMIWRRWDAGLILAALSCVGLALVCGDSIYEDYWCYARAFNWLPGTIWLAAAQARQRWLLALLALPGIAALNTVASMWFLLF